MATAVSRRIATAMLAGFVLVPSGMLLAVPAYAEDAAGDSGVGEPVYEEATPDPVTGLYPGQYVPATESSPATPGWITGGTLQEGTSAQPVAKPAAKPVAVKPVAVKPATVKPAVAKPAPVRVARRSQTTTRVGSTSGSASTSASVGEATVLPFTGPGRLELQLGTGAALVLFGAFAMFAARSRPVR